MLLLFFTFLSVYAQIVCFYQLFIQYIQFVTCHINTYMMCRSCPEEEEDVSWLDS